MVRPCPCREVGGNTIASRGLPAAHEYAVQWVHAMRKPPTPQRRSFRGRGLHTGNVRG